VLLAAAFKYVVDLLPLPYYAFPFRFALSGLIAGVIANWLCMRFLEGAGLLDIGLHWNGRNLLIGLAGGMTSGLLVTAVPVLLGLAVFRQVDKPIGGPAVATVLAALLLGAALYEELTMRGYPLQVLMRSLGLPAAAVLTALLFASGHLFNRNISAPALANTFLAGVVLAYCFWAAGDLWFPIGLHYGWNMTILLLGTPLSGMPKGLMGNIEMTWKIGPVWSGGAYGPEGGVLSTVAFCLWLLWAWKAPLRRRAAWMLTER
jgi:uncharacterized protein